MAQYRTPMMESLENRTLLSVNTPVGLTPQQIRHAYNADKLWYRDHSIEQTYKATGIGQAIAIVDPNDHPRITSDFKVFNRTFGLPSYGQDGQLLLQKKVAPAGNGVTLSQPPIDYTADTEIALDVEWAHVIAPWAKIYLVEAQSQRPGDLLSAIDFARHIPGVSTVSMSFTAFLTTEPPYEGAYDPYVTTPAGHIAGGGVEGGITFVAASGDYGSGNFWPAVSPNVVGVGGTVLNVDASGNWLGESAWSRSGGGPPIYESKANSPNVAMAATNIAVYNSMPHGPNHQTGWEAVDGTSASTPMWAGIIALINEGRTLLHKPSLDGVKDVLPWLATDPQGDFHDITVGSNGLYSATPGVDYVTGIGTPKIHKVARDLILWDAPVLA